MKLNLTEPEKTWAWNYLTHITSDPKLPRPMARQARRLRNKFTENAPYADLATDERAFLFAIAQKFSMDLVREMPDSPHIETIQSLMDKLAGVQNTLAAEHSNASSVGVLNG